MVKLAVPRCNTSSRKQFFNKNGSLTNEDLGRSLDELWNVFKVAQPGRKIYLLSVGFDAFSTCASNYTHVTNNWPHLDISLVIAVPQWFPGTKTTFPIARNGIRYGTFALCDIVRVLSSHGSLNLPHIVEYLNILRRVNMAKMQYVHAMPFTTEILANIIC